MRQITHQSFCELEPLQALKGLEPGATIEVQRLSAQAGSHRRRNKVQHRSEKLVLTVTHITERGLACDPHDIAWCGCSSMGWFFSRVIK